MIDLSPTEATGWQPPTGITTFSGQPLPPERDLFLRPPDEIGSIVAAWSDVKVGQTLWKLSMKLAFAGAILAIGIGAMLWLYYDPASHKRMTGTQVIIFLSAFVVPIICIAYAFKPKYLGYLSNTGAAIYQTRGTRGDASGEVVKFEEIADIKLIETPQGKGWTEWKFQCFNAQGEQIMKKKGAYKRFAGKVVPNSSTYVMAIAIQACWRSRTNQSVSESL